MPTNSLNLNKILFNINKSLATANKAVVDELNTKLDVAQAKADTIEADLKLASVEINKLKAGLSITNAILVTKEDRVIVVVK